MALQVNRFARPAGSDATALMVVLGLAAAMELAILRTFTRTAIHIPALEQLQEPYEWLAGTGRYAYFVAVGLVFPALAILGLRIGTLAHPSRWLALFAVAGFAIASLAAVAGATPVSALGAATMWSVAVLAAASVAAASSRKRAIPLACFAAAFALSGAYTVLPDVAGGAAQPAWLLDGAEVAGVAFALTLPLTVVRGHDRASVIAGVVMATFALAFFLGNGSTSRFLLLWNVGLAGTLPGVAYAIAAGAITYTGVRLWRSGSPLAASGVLLLVAGGIGLHSSYQSALAVAGLAALYLALAERGATAGR